MSSLAGARASSIGTAMVMSAMLPGVSATATIRPQPSARQWIFVVLPPRETPTAWLNSPLFHLTPSDAGRWRDGPPEYGPAKTIYNRYTRWAPKRSLATHLHRHRRCRANP